MKIILDLDQIVREMGIPEEAYVKWKAANLDQSQEGGGVRWTALEDSGLLEKSFSKDLKTG